MICTFYSYKGGVGRSMALANVADILARRGLRVLMIDFDLEAPGLEQYFQIDQRKVRANLGLFDLILRYKAAMSLPASAADERAQEFRQLQERFISQIYPRRDGGGQLDLMTAGQRGDDEQLAQYALNLRQFDWQDFFFKWGGELFFQWLRLTLDRKLYDIVLVDSRTGVTEMGGICAYQLADVIVVLCAANQQNLEGTHDIVRNFSSSRVKMLRNNRDLPMIVVPARIELQNEALVTDYRKRFEDLFGEFVPPALASTGITFWDLLIPYEPQYAFQERVLATDNPNQRRSAMRPALQKLVEAIGALAGGDEPLRISQQANAKIAAEPEYEMTSRSAGYDVFMSYSRPDADAVRAIARALVERKLSVFLDVDLLPVGAQWERALAKAIEQCRACAIFVGAGTDYPWRREFVRAEIEGSISRGLKIVPVLLPGASLPPATDLPAYLSGLQWHRFESLNDVAAFDRVAGALASTGPTRRAAATVAEVPPYKGLLAFDEPDAPFFFGREKMIEELVASLRVGSFLAMVGASSIGKTSAVRAGLVPALRRGAIRGAEEWDYIFLTPGDEPFSALVRALVDKSEPNSKEPEFLQGVGPLLDYLRLTFNDRRRFVVIDQFEELFSRVASAASEGEFIDRSSAEFVEAIVRIAQNLSAEISIVMTIRSDFLDQVLQLHSLSELVRNNLFIVGPLSREQLRLAIEAPALQAGVSLEPALTDLLLKDLADAPGALALMQYVLYRLWQQRRSGYLTAEAYREMGGVLHALAREAEEFLAQHPKSGPTLQRIFTFKLASVREDGTPARRRARRSEFNEDEWRLVGELIDRRLLITGTSGAGESYVEVAHEAIFRFWDRLRGWLAAERDFLAWRNRLEIARQVWLSVPADSRNDALLMGFALTQAKHYLAERPDDFGPDDQQFVASSLSAAANETRAMRRRRRRVQALVGGLAAAMVLGVVGWVNQAYLSQKFRYYAVTRPYIRSQIAPYVLSTATERALAPGSSFKECASECPEMMVLPAGSFTMGSPDFEAGRLSSESPQHLVTIAKPFAVSKYELTFDDWDACAGAGDCNPLISDGGFGRGIRPVINVSWEDATRYVAWLSKATGKPYRLLSEAEYEYAARAGTLTAYPWGKDIGKANANCATCGSQWDNMETAPIGSFAPNAFGLYDMVGNVWEWVEDCQHENYTGAPDDGSSWFSGANCYLRVIRGGSWASPPRDLRSARRDQFSSVGKNSNVGFRVARTLYQ